MNDDISKSARDLLRKWRQLDHNMKPAIWREKPSCTKGCDACCYLLAYAHLADGVILAEHLLQKPDWKAFVPKLRQAALLTVEDGRGVETNAYFRRKHPCVFLDTQTRQCTVYEKRPMACRAHYVVSHPSECSPDKHDGWVGAINLRPIEKVAFDISVRLNGTGEPVFGPIPLVVLYVMGVISQQRGRAEDAKVIAEALEGLPDPQTWIAEGRELAKGEETIKRERGVL